MSHTSVFGLLSSVSSSSNLFAQLTVCWFGDQLQVKWGWCCWVWRNLREFYTHSHFRILIWLWFYEKPAFYLMVCYKCCYVTALILGISLKTGLLRFCCSQFKAEIKLFDMLLRLVKLLRRNTGMTDLSQSTTHFNSIIKFVTARNQWPEEITERGHFS